jgi:hypothetical protein
MKTPGKLPKQVIPSVYGNQGSFDGPCEELLSCVMIQAIKDYMSDKKPRDDGRIKKKTDLRESAYSYIFRDTRDSEHYVFGFKSICKKFNICPEKAREALKKAKAEHEFQKSNGRKKKPVDGRDST